MITMIRILVLLAVVSITLSACMGNSSGTMNSRQAAKDSLARAKQVADSLRIEKLLAVGQYPFLKGGKWSGVIPVADPTEIPDPNREYKLLFELTAKNSDSLAKEINAGLDEVARILNLHVASGIPAKNIIPVIAIHGPGIEALVNDQSYKKKHSIDNPNIRLVHDLENIGAKFIACGQAMAFFDVKREELLPEIKVTYSVQTVLSNYQLQGFVLYPIEPDR